MCWAKVPQHLTLLVTWLGQSKALIYMELSKTFNSLLFFFSSLFFTKKHKGYIKPFFGVSHPFVINYLYKQRLVHFNFRFVSNISQHQWLNHFSSTPTKATTATAWFIRTNSIHIHITKHLPAHKHRLLKSIHRACWRRIFGHKSTCNRLSRRGGLTPLWPLLHFSSQ